MKVWVLFKQYNSIMKNKYIEEDYINKCKEFGLIYLGFHKHKHKGTMVNFICPQHKHKGMQSKDWSHFKTYTYGCSYCSGRGKTTDEIRTEIKQDHVEIISEYLGNEKPIKCKCKLCGNIWTTLPKVLITNGSGCPKCGKKKAIKGETKTREAFIFQLALINPDIEVIGEYKSTHKSIKCKCKICNGEWNAYPANLLNKSAGCIYCNMSIGEREMLRTLTKLCIHYIPQFSFDDGIHKRKLRFDAYNMENKIAFEYNGEQHYKAVDFAGKGDEWAKRQYELTRERDASKYDYCNRNGIKLVIIPYWERNNMKEIITKNLKGDKF